MKNVFAIICVICAVFCGPINGLEFKDCGSKVGKFVKVTVSECDTTKQACILKRDSNATIAIDFELQSVDKCDQVIPVVHGIIMGVEMPFPLPNGNGCVDSGLNCPITGQTTTFKYAATLPVLKQYPKVRVDVKWELKNENKEDIICVLIPAKIE